MNYPVYLGGNRGRGQVYPDGSKSNNTSATAPRTGVVKEIIPGGNRGGFRVVLETKDGNIVTEKVPPGPELLIKVGQSVRADEPITTNPNVGGFGQTETEIVLQRAARVQWLLAFFVTVVLTQVLLVLKKKQFEKVQLAEINYLILIFSRIYIKLWW